MILSRTFTIRFYGDLSIFLTAARKGRSFSHTVKGKPSIKDTVEALRVPHTEIDAILVDDPRAEPDPKPSLPAAAEEESDLTQTDVAALVGASRERVNQVIVDFKESGFISVDPSHHVTVHDLQALVSSCQ